MNEDQAKVGYEAVIPSFPRYTADMDGNIRSYCGRKGPPGTVLSSTIGFGKYKSVNVCDESGKRFGRFVHELVAEAFLGPRPEGLVIDHIDGNRMNNAPSNLRYCTMKENHENQNNLGLNAYQKRGSRKVVAIRGGVKTVFANASEAARELRCDLSSIVKCLTGRIGIRVGKNGKTYPSRCNSVKGFLFEWAVAEA